MRRIVIGLLWLTCGSLTAADEDPYLKVYHRTLEAHGVTPGGAGALEYLRGLLPDPGQEAKAAALIVQLGDSRFERREEATQRLLRMAQPPLEALNAAAEGSDPEVRWRARRILDDADARTANIMFAALKTIEIERTEQAAGVLLAVVPFCRPPHLKEAVRGALRAVAGPGDVERLQMAVAGDDAEVRIAAAGALAAVLAEDRLVELHPLLESDDEQLVLITARALADRGDRRSLPALVELLKSDEALIRADAAATLQALTGENLGFASYDTPEKRDTAIAAWQGWMTEHGRTAKLHFPLKLRRSARGDLRGNTLVSTGSQQKVMELAPDGTVVWSYAIDAWSAEKLQNGNVLIASYTDNKVVEVDPQGKLVWEYPSVNAMTAKPLANGNYLVADFSGQKVMEIEPRTKKVVWQQPTPENCFDADRLPNGNTIVGCPNIVREMTPEGEAVHEWQIPGRLNGFQALENGNIIVANYGQSRVYELTREGETVWEMSEPNPCDVFLLPGGTMLVSTAARIIEVSPDRKTKREIHTAAYGSARR